jgi:CspA family cold shock protein
MATPSVSAAMFDFTPCHTHFQRGTTMSERVSGTVKWFNNAKGFGFISHKEGSDVFVHFRSIRGDGYRTLDEGQAVEFNLVGGPKGLQAEDVIKI